MGKEKSGGSRNKMKILYIGHYKENSGWSNAAINNILALDSIGIDVVCRDIKLTGTPAKVPQKILELESKSLDNVDFCIQHVLPHHLTGTKKFKKNIAYFVHESSSIKHNSWFVNLQNMDEVWVPTNYAKNNLSIDGIKDIKVVPHAFDVFKYQNEYPLSNVSRMKSFKFYTIADINDRKNIDSIIRCYFSEFDISDEVMLILKIKKYGMSSEDLDRYIANKIDNTKKQLRMHKNPELYPKCFAITSDIDEQQIYSLHQSCDCFVGISHGEGWSIPAFEAMCFGKTPICSNEGGPSEFIDPNDKSTGTLINGSRAICNHSDPAFPNIFTGFETWFQPDEQEVKNAMRYYYSNKNSVNKIAGIKQSRNFSFEKIGNTIKELLNDQ